MFKHILYVVAGLLALLVGCTMFSDSEAISALAYSHNANADNAIVYWFAWTSKWCAIGGGAITVIWNAMMVLGARQAFDWVRQQSWNRLLIEDFGSSMLLLKRQHNWLRGLWEVTAMPSVLVVGDMQWYYKDVTADSGDMQWYYKDVTADSGDMQWYYKDVTADSGDMQWYYKDVMADSRAFIYVPTYQDGSRITDSHEFTRHVDAWCAEQAWHQATDIAPVEPECYAS